MTACTAVSPAMPSTSSRAVPGLILAALSLLSAFLLFQVQPIISKFILPWFGGSPGVWTTCMLFFQVVLFAGYAYAHTLTLLPRRWQGMVHGLLLGAAIAMLPIAPADAWKPTGTEDPALRILLLLLASVGLPYFVLSSTSPLVQVWFTRTTGGANPWRLYALSNIGSLAALLSYPLFFEVHWDVLEQTTLWAVGFGAFVVLSLAGVWLDRKQTLAEEAPQAEAAPAPSAAEVAASDHPGWGRRLCWVLLPALASSVLLAATNHVCQDVAVIPFLWVVPLSLYLLTFIICFEHERWYVRISVLWAVVALPVLFITCTENRLQKEAVWTKFEQAMHNHVQPLLNKLTGLDCNLASIDVTPNFIWELGWCFGAMFLACMLCHGELVRLKPAPRRLTEFYLLMSAGGALGGLFVSLGAPHVFTSFAEWPISLIVMCALVCVILLRAVLKQQRWKEWVLLVLITGVTCGILWAMYDAGLLDWDLVQKQIDEQKLPAGALYGSLGGIALCLLVLGWRMVRRGRLRPGLFSALQLAMLFTFLLMAMSDLGFKKDEKIERVRNFYGMLSVSEDTYTSEGQLLKYRELVNGGIIHGMQNLGGFLQEEPTTYYGHQTGVGKALDSIKEKAGARIGVVGMGAGTAACYARSGHSIRFYDINPDVVRIADKYFTYLADARKRGATVEVVVSDARLALEREKSQQFDVLLLDAFSGDSVPVHLLTQEAFTIYDRHMKKDGIIAVHITNSYLVLAPVIEKIAAATGFKTTRIATELEGDNDSTDYILVTRNEAFLKATPPSLVGNEVELKHDVRLWTDRYHNLLRILDIPENVKE